jgi:hypothetical protein
VLDRLSGRAGDGSAASVLRYGYRIDEVDIVADKIAASSRRRAGDRRPGAYGRVPDAAAATAKPRSTRCSTPSSRSCSPSSEARRRRGPSWTGPRPDRSENCDVRRRIDPARASSRRA